MLKSNETYKKARTDEILMEKNKRNNEERYIRDQIVITHLTFKKV